MNAIGRPSLELVRRTAYSNARGGVIRPIGSARSSRSAQGQVVGLRRDSELFRALHDEHAHGLLSFVVRLTGDRARAQDVVQETLLRAWRNPSVLDQTGGSARAWLFTVARRIVIDQSRSASRRRELLTDDVPERPADDTAQQTVDRLLVRAALQTLSVEHQQTLFETYFRGASVAQAAGRLGVSAGTVKSRTHYALRALRQAIDAMGGVA